MKVSIYYFHCCQECFPRTTEKKQLKRITLFRNNCTLFIYSHSTHLRNEVESVRNAPTKPSCMRITKCAFLSGDLSR
jgi:hypothetical protein